MPRAMTSACAGASLCRTSAVPGSRRPSASSCRINPSREIALEARVDAGHGPSSGLVRQHHLPQPAVRIVMIALLHCAHLVVQLLQHSGLAEMPGPVPPGQRLDWRHDHGRTDGANLREALHLSIEVDRALFHHDPHVSSEPSQHSVGVARENAAWGLGCQVLPVSGDGNEVGSVELLDESSLPGVKVQADGEAALLGQVHALEVGRVVAGGLAVSAAQGRRAVVVVVHQRVEGLELAGAVVAADRVRKDDEAVLGGRAQAELRAAAKYEGANIQRSARAVWRHIGRVPHHDLVDAALPDLSRHYRHAETPAAVRHPLMAHAVDKGANGTISHMKALKTLKE
mmetsp:Transcript_1601/g.4783  ORF Transcript_1601/g.4783 Transcript_1601/m.4783 type:complete len:342 (+) Transcript_1601:401-1426(+)